MAYDLFVEVTIDSEHVGAKVYELPNLMEIFKGKAPALGPYWVDIVA